MTCASDIPETFRTGNSMAQALATYIDCPERIQRIVAENFSRPPPPTHVIRKMREKHLQSRLPQEVPLVDTRWNHREENSRLARANQQFVAALLRERAPA